jgi:hypothetical protein
MGGWNKDGWHGYWYIDRPHSVMAHMVGMGGQHQNGKKLGFKVRTLDTSKADVSVCSIT